MRPVKLLKKYRLRTAGKGLQGIVNGSKVIAGNKKLMTQFNIPTPQEIDSIVESIVLVGIDDQFAGYVTIADEMKEDAKEKSDMIDSRSNFWRKLNNPDAE